MAGRFSFGIMGQTTGELLSGLDIEIKDSSNNTKAATNPSAGQLQVIDNNDGTYYVDSLPTAMYTVWTSGAQQDELTNISHIDDVGVNKINNAITIDKLKNTTDNATDVAWAGSLLVQQLALKENADATILKEGDLSDSVTSNSTTVPANSKAVKDARDDCVLITNVVNNLTSTDTDKPLSAAQGKHLEDNKIETSDIEDSLTSQSATKVLSAKQGYNLNADITAINEQATVNGTTPTTMSPDDFVMDSTEVNIRQDNVTSTNYIGQTKTLAQNLSTLDQRLGFLTQLDSAEGLWNIIWKGMVQQTYNTDTGIIGSDEDLENTFKITTDSSTHDVQTYYDLFKATVYKIPSMREVAFYYKGKVASQTEGKVKLTFGGLAKEGNVVTTTNFGNLKGIYLDISQLANYQVYDVSVAMKINDDDGGTQDFTIGSAMCVAKYHITNVVEEQENPTA